MENIKKLCFYKTTFNSWVNLMRYENFFNHWGNKLESSHTDKTFLLKLCYVTYLSNQFNKITRG